MQTVSPDEVTKVVKLLKNSKSTGVDNINTLILKEALPIILPALTHVINFSITTPTFPSIWKQAKVIPLLTKPEAMEV